MGQPIRVPNLHILWFAAELSIGRRVFDLVRLSDNLLMLQGLIQAIGAMFYGIVRLNWPSEVLLQALDGSGFDYIALVPKQLC